jgi:hypothetical protein
MQEKEVMDFHVKVDEGMQKLYGIKAAWALASVYTETAKMGQVGAPCARLRITADTAPRSLAPSSARVARIAGACVRRRWCFPAGVEERGRGR